MGGRGWTGWRDWTGISSHPAFRACPVLLASDLLPLGHYPRDNPALAPRQRTRFGKRDGVADLRFVAFVMGDELRRLLLTLAVDRVADLPLHGDHDGLVHLVADDGAGQL